MDDIIAAIILIFLVLAFIAGCIGIGYLWEQHVCYAKTSEIGFPARYSFWAGCQIEVEPGKWIPLESYYFKQE